jgi:hypothetical protein
VTVCFPAPISQVELDRTANWFAAIESDNGAGKIWSSGAVPNAELNDFYVMTGDRSKSAAKVAGEPTCLQLELARDAFSGKERAFMDTRRITKLGVKFSGLHLGGSGASIEGSVRLGDKKIRAARKMNVDVTPGGCMGASVKRLPRVSTELGASQKRPYIRLSENWDSALS